MMHIIVSDLHIGLPYFERRRFLHLLDTLPDDATLVLNGDTVHDPTSSDLSAEHIAVLHRLAAESTRRRVIWVAGNHDNDYRPDVPHNIEFLSSHSIGKRLVICHGTEFVPARRALDVIMRLTLPIRIWGESFLSVRYVKRVPVLYRILTSATMRNAARYAAGLGFEAIAYGHTHVTEDRIVRGVRCINTGTWSEWPAHYLAVDDSDMRLQEGVSP